MILHCNFEELQALSSGAELVLSGSYGTAGGAVAAPSEAVAYVELLRPHLTGDIGIATLAEQRRHREAVALICDNLRMRLEGEVVEHDPSHEEAVNLYFDYGYAIRVLDRLDQMGAEMAAMIELMTGEAPTDRAAANVNFPD